ncbi:MAG TPA: hypothetical protein VGM18_20995 [Candidatus Sulfotelmatobacter sp.]|jgi:hypothetical protein
MNRSASLFVWPLVLIAALLSCGCGSRRQLQSVTLSPGSADAKDFSNGQVPFTATGTFSKAPSPAQLTSQDVQWCIGSSDGACEPAGMTYPSVDQNGAAQCGPTFVGTVIVLAGTAEPGVSDAAVFKPFGSAELTCP